MSMTRTQPSSPTRKKVVPTLVIPHNNQADPMLLNNAPHGIHSTRLASLLALFCSHDDCKSLTCVERILSRNCIVTCSSLCKQLSHCSPSIRSIRSCILLLATTELDASAFGKQVLQGASRRSTRPTYIDAKYSNNILMQRTVEHETNKQALETSEPNDIK